jgi:hypothetical protein
MKSLTPPANYFPRVGELWMLNHWSTWHEVVSSKAGMVYLRTTLRTTGGSKEAGTYNLSLGQPYNSEALYTWKVNEDSLKGRSKCASCEKWFLVEDYLCPSCRAESV